MAETILPRKIIICSGVEIRPQDENISGRIGIIVQNESGILFCVSISALSPPKKRAIIEAETETIKLEPAINQRKGLSTDDGSIESLIALIPLTERQFVSSQADGFVNVGPVVDPIDALGNQVVFKSARGTRYGVLSAINSRLRLVNPKTQSPEMYTGALEITSAEDEEFAVAGDAGGVVFTENGRPVGIVLGRKNGVTFAAPLATFFTQYKLLPLDAFAAIKHNTRASKLDAEFYDTSINQSSDLSITQNNNLTDSNLTYQNKMPDHELGLLESLQSQIENLERLCTEAA